MKKIDLYIIGKYLSTFFFTVLLISMVAVVMDFADRIDKFMNCEATSGEIIVEYYLNFLPWINGLLWPLFALLAVIFFTSRMASDSEIVSVLSAGVSYRRFLMPYMLCATFIASLLWIGNNFVIPNSTRKKNEFEAKHIHKSQNKTRSNDIHFYLNPTEKVYIRFYRTRDSTAHTFRLEKFKDGKIIEFLKAGSLTLKEYPNRWTLKNYERRYCEGLKESLLIAEGEKMDTTFNFSPDDFVYHSKQMEMLNSSELRKFINTEQEKGIGAAKKYMFELHRRTSDPFTIIILTLIGVSLASRKSRGGMGLHLAAGVIIGSAFVILSKFSATFVNNLSMSPMIGAWIPNIIFTLLAIFLLYKAQK